MQYLTEAVREFSGTREEVRVMVADCEAAIAGGDVTGALKRLRRVPESSPQYTRACVAMAEIYLKHKRDQAAYIQCFLDMVVSTTTSMLQPCGDPLPGHSKLGCYRVVLFPDSRFLAKGNLGCLLLHTATLLCVTGRTNTETTTPIACWQRPSRPYTSQTKQQVLMRSVHRSTTPANRGIWYSA